MGVAGVCYRLCADGKIGIRLGPSRYSLQPAVWCDSDVAGGIVTAWCDATG